tara:strand:- start:53 stop:478 length:426 start_codon:yes stop_codon:yes gene_type:complete
MNKKFLYYFFFLIIPVYLFGGLVIDHFKYGHEIVNTLEMPENNHKNQPSQYLNYQPNSEKLKKPVIKSSIKTSWLLNIKYTDYNQMKKNLVDLGFDKIYKNNEKNEELLLGPFIDKEIAEYMKKKLEKNLSANISLKKITN